MEIPFAIENLSTYISLKSSEMTEWEFYSEVVERADCKMMLDVNNVFVSAFNHRFDGMEYLKNIPLNRVVQMHVAGHTDKGTHLLDTHNNYVRDEVWELYRYVYKETGGVSTLLEWDNDFLSFADTHKEALKARKYQE